MKQKIILVFLLNFTLAYSFGGDLPIHESFTLTTATLKQLIKDQPEEIQQKIMADPKRFLDLADYLLDQPEELMYLADKNHALSREQAPKETVRPSDYGIPSTRVDREVSALIIKPLKEMVDAAKRENLEIVFASGYRPYDYQETLYNRYVSKYGKDEADRFSARPGTSQHQLGTAVDFGTISEDYQLTDEGKWLAAHAGDFGFSLSYPQGMEDITGYMWECWHYRYITKEGVILQKDFFLNIQQYLMEFWHFHRNELLSARR